MSKNSNDETDELQAQLSQLWKDARDQAKQGVNVELVLRWCRSAERALGKSSKFKESDARYAIGMAEHELARAKELCKPWHFWLGVITTLIELAFLVTFGWIIYNQTWAHPQTEFLTAFAAWVPAGAFVWGALGATVWTLYWSAYWTKRSLFNGRYALWHLSLPFIGAVMGAALCAAALAGFLGLSLDTTKAPAIYILVLVSFAGGLLTHKTLKFLERFVGKILNVPGSIESKQEEADQIGKKADEGEQRT